MACTQPLEAWRSHVLKTVNGKDLIAFNRELVNFAPYESIQLPCGQCLSCRFDHAKQWAVRCVHEASLYPQGQTSFITLTFADEHLYTRRHNCTKCEKYLRKVKAKEAKIALNPEHVEPPITFCSIPSVCHRDFTLFMKRLRKKVAKTGHSESGALRKLRYFHVGEYGSKLGRPHHHALLFGYQFPDLKYWKTTKSGNIIYRSAILESLWPYGFSSVGELTWQTAAYCARYSIKKVGKKHAEEHYKKYCHTTKQVVKVEPEYITMSRRPGIARDWIERYTSDVYPKDAVHICGRVFKSPRYYDRMYDLESPEEFRKIKNRRLTAAKNNVKNDTYERRRSRRIIDEHNAKKLGRDLENES